MLYAFENGVKKLEITISNTITMKDDMYIGYRATSGSSGGFVGYLDEIRVSNIARWTTDFTPPTEPYVVYKNTEPGEVYVKESGKWKKILTGGK